MKLKIDKKMILEVIKEEVEKIKVEVKPLKEVNPAHRKDGTFAEKGNGHIYSLTKNAEDDVGEESELKVPARGKITKSGKIAAKFGMNTSPDKQCGRLNIDGKPKPKQRSCKDYPKNYWNESEEEFPRWDSDGKLLDSNDIDDDYIKISKAALNRLLDIEQSLSEGKNTTEQERCLHFCRQRGLKTFEEFLSALNDIKKAENGELFGSD